MISIAEPKKAVNQEMLDAVANTLKSGKYIQAEETEKFEKEFAGYVEAKYGVAVSSGTAALHLALLSLDIGPGDEVITTTNSFIATANPIVHVGAKPVLVDVESDTYTIDSEKIEKAVTKKTKAIIPVHIYGHPADMDPIMEIAEKHNIAVIEDACQAHGAEYKGHKIGSIGDAACFSFFPSKVMTVCGDGGMVTTNNEEISLKVKMYQNQGRKPTEKYSHDLIGFNYRMSEVAATIGRIELKKLSEWIDRRREIAEYYNRMLDGVGDIVTPVERDWAKVVYYVYTIRTSKRNELQKSLSERKIASQIYYPVPIHLQPAYARFGFMRGMYPVTEKIVDEILSIPIHQYLTDEELSTVASRIKEFYA